MRWDSWGGTALIAAVVLAAALFVHYVFGII